MTFMTGENMIGGYGSVDILNGCSISVDRGEIAVVVGPNGAGKSTAMKAIFGMLNLRGGKITIGGEDITALAPFERVNKGMAFVPQTHNVFTSMTVEENIVGLWDEGHAFVYPLKWRKCRYIITTD